LTALGNYSFVVNWGDGSSNTTTSWNQLEVTDEYASPGVKTIDISGTIDG